MSSVSKCFRFQTRGLLKSTLVFTSIYILIVLGLLSITIMSEGIRISSLRSCFFIGSLIFTFVYATADYRSTFNYLLINGNTRKTIYLSTVITNIALSVSMTVISVLLTILDDIISKLISSSDSIEINIIHLLYPNSNIATEFLFMAVLFIMVSSFSSLYGTLAYKLGKYFITPFWILFGLSVFLIPATGMNEPMSIQQLIKSFFFLGNPNGILLAPVNFTAAALIFSLGSYLISSRQPQTAPVV